MNWKILILVAFIFANITSGRPGIRTPPARLLRDRNRNDPLISSTPTDDDKLSAVPQSVEIILQTNYTYDDNDDKISTKTSNVGVTATTTTTSNSAISSFESDVSSSSEITPILTNRRIFNQKTVEQQKNEAKIIAETSRHDTSYNSHMGVAVPLSTDDLEKEMNATVIKIDYNNNKISSTPKEGISTWILLSGAGPTKGPSSSSSSSSSRNDGKIEKVTRNNDKAIQTTKQSQTSKTKKFVTTTTTTNKNLSTATTTVAPPNKKLDDEQHEEEKSEKHEKFISNTNIVRRKKPTPERRTEFTTKKVKKAAAVTATTPSSTTTTTTTTTVEPESSSFSSTVTSSTPETTTFLILEPKDADFDMPQDRSPGSTTKKPKNKNKNNKNKKTNKNKTDIEKKPTKTPIKNKPLSTKIYDYLAREVMPTVGMGLFGLAVTAGLATYFLGPLAAIRRSYDIADRKDDIYFYNNEEYAGTDGQSEEEVFGKVIAGTPVNSPYRNSIKYTIYRPNQLNPNKPPPRGQGPYDAKHPQYRYRYTAPPYHMSAQHAMYSKPKPHDPFPQQYFRYNNEMNVYRTNAQNPSVLNNNNNNNNMNNNINNNNNDNNNNNNYNNNNNNPPNIENNEDKLDKQQLNSVEMPSIVTPEPPLQDFPVEPPSSEEPIEDNVLKRRSQFVVGSVQTPNDSEDNTIMNPQGSVVDSVPEHGPRRRRKRRYLINNNELNDNENEVDGNIRNMKIQSTSTVLPTDIASTLSTAITENSQNGDGDQNKDSSSSDSSSSNNSTESSTIDETTNSISPTPSDIVQMLRTIFKLKIQMGLSFLQNTTDAFQRYLRNIEKRVDESKLFANRHMQ